MKFTIILSLLFLVSELSLLIFRRSKDQSNTRRKDKKSLLLFWITIPTCITLGFFAADYYPWHRINYIAAITGYLLIGFGSVVRWVSIIQLRKAFTVDVAVNNDQKLITTGLYKKIRHPSYTGMILIIIGLAIAMNSWVSALIVIIPISLVLIYRINVEEKLLADVFGEKYKAYKSITYRIIPGLY
jgi:protein-S-isoprenylcysteine O-methyltransferase Ste14